MKLAFRLRRLTPIASISSWPCSTRPSTWFRGSLEDVDGRVSAFGRPGHDVEMGEA
jgi:hypothetical protein